jgi:hypothetical protein
MVITLFFLAILVFGIYRNLSDDEGIASLLLGGFGLGICLLIIFFNGYIGGQSTVIGYNQDKAKIEAAISNPSLTGEERASAIDLATNDNIIILTAKRWYRDPFIGWFGQAAIVDLPPFDLSRIPSASSEIKIKK